jgi:hypothetical protein
VFPDLPAGGAEELGHHRDAEAMLLARHRDHERGAPRLGRRRAAEAGGELAQDLLEGDQPERDLDEAAAVLFPPFAEAAGEGCQKFQTDPLGIHSGLLKLFDRGGEGARVAGDGPRGERIQFRMARAAPCGHDEREDLMAQRALDLKVEAADAALDGG